MLRCIQIFLFLTIAVKPAFSVERSHPRLMANQTELETAKKWLQQYPWYKKIFAEHSREIDAFISHGPIYVSPIKQTYQYQMYTCPKHGVELRYDLFQPFEHRCPKDTLEVFKGGKYDMAWAGWYNRVLANYLVWMGLLYHTSGDEKYAQAGKEILMKFAELYLKYPTDNTILGPAHVFFGTLSESFWGVDMAYGYDLLYHYHGFSHADHAALKEKLFYPLAKITQLFPESASNRQLWYNNVSAAVGFLYNDQSLIDFAIKGQYGFEWQLSSAVPESGFWPEWSGYHFVALRGMIHLAEMARHNGYDLYHLEIAGHSMKKMFDAPFLLIKPNFEFPRIKDSGGGSILEYAPYYEAAYAVYRDPKYLALLTKTNLQRGTQVVGETSALGRAPEPVTLFNLVPELPKDTTNIYPQESIDLKGNGFAVLRNGKDSTARYLYLDYGIMGGEHGHPDRLQMGYYADGQNWIVDPLNESYQVPNLQLWYRQTIAHNTLVVDQSTQTWANGYAIFFGALPDFQVAAGGTDTAYPGVSLTRTLLQVGEYFIDLFDAQAPEKRMYDLPLHGFGSIEIMGVNLEKQPIDLFGNKPGIPGYDQLTDIYSGNADTDWHGVFTYKGKHLQFRAIGEKGTNVYKAQTPPIGGFYKQMVKEQVPMPMLMSRRVTDRTRFAGLMEAYTKRPMVQHFEQGDEPNSYRIIKADGMDYIHAGSDLADYWVVKEKENIPTLAAGFNISEIKHRSLTLLSSPFTLDKVQCSWSSDAINVMVGEPFTQIRIWAPQAKKSYLNGNVATCKRDGDYILVGQSQQEALSLTTPLEKTLFLGKNNTISIKVWNPKEKPITGRVTLKLAEDWQQRVTSQLADWGGIVNLIATNKGPVERKIFPISYQKTAAWIDGISKSKTIPGRGMAAFDFNIAVPNDAAPVVYPLLVTFGKQTLKISLTVQAPVTARLMLPNGQREQLCLELVNQTSDSITVATKLTLDSAWQSSATPSHVAVAGKEKRQVLFPVKLDGYSQDNQKYPVQVQLSCEKYLEKRIHDFYVGIAHYAAQPPSLDGSWLGWSRTNPMLINKATQIGKLLFGNQPWKGERDLSAKITAMYDDLYLYVGAQVTDDSLVSHWDFPRMSYPWDTDCMEVMLDARMNSTQGYDPPTPGFYRHLSLAEYRETDFGAEAWQGAGAGGPLLPKPNLVPGAETFFHENKDGYCIITRYPLSCFKNMMVGPGVKIGFDMAINDNDGTNYRRNQHIWAGYNQNQSWWDIGTSGALIFGDKD